MCNERKDANAKCLFEFPLNFEYEDDTDADFMVLCMPDWYHGKLPADKWYIPLATVSSQK